MTLKRQKIISAFLITVVAAGGFWALIYVVNLNQPIWFLKTAFAIYLYLAFKITLLYDLHFKNPGALNRAKSKHESVPHWLIRAIKIVLSAFHDRISHLIRGHHLVHFLNYLILPGMLFWSTAAIFYMHFGSLKTQVLFAALSSYALVLTYWYLKESFIRKTERVESDIFVALSAVKIYTAAIMFTAALGVMKSFCLKPELFAAGILSLTFLLVYQALFQHRLINLKNTAIALLIGIIQALVAYFVYVNWSFNYFTAGILMTAIYNLLWGTFHYYLDKALTLRVFFEILLVCAIVALMVFSTTNFKAKILDACVF